MRKKIISILMIICMIVGIYSPIVLAKDKETIKMNETSYILDQSGRTLYEIYHGENRKSLSYEEIPDVIKDIFILTEDRQFFDHSGFNIVGIARAMFVNAKEKEIKQGGSTITQQLARNVYLTQERTWKRKIKELNYARKIEKNYSKEEILEMYINSIYFQNGNYGIEAASQYYFSMPTHLLTLAEMAFLCAIPNNPTLYNPLENMDMTVKRQQRILDTLYENDVIDDQEYQEAKAQEIKLKIKNNPIQYPDYVSYVYDELKEMVAQHEGLDPIKDKEKVNEKFKEFTAQGVQIHTSLDPYIQQQAVDVVNKYGLPEDVQAAVTVINHETNTIEAIVGGKNYKAFDFNRAFQAYRQPGSTIKPLLDYAPYIEETGAGINDYVNSRELTVDGWTAKNDNLKSYTDVKMRTAFAYSFNTTAIRLMDHIGIDKAYSYLDKFQFAKVTDTDKKRYPTAIGGFEYGMSVTEMTSAYTTFSNDGVYIKPHAITKVTDLHGKPLLTWKDKKQNVWSKETNEKMRDLLQEVVKLGTHNQITVDAPYLGGKTGTTNDYKDFWYMGVTPHYTMGVWVGNDDGKSVESVRYERPHIGIWNEIAKQNDVLLRP
ncbi:MAG: transglycosylase domain-containing protein [Bacillaceae bacterium]